MQLLLNGGNLHKILTKFAVEVFPDASRHLQLFDISPIHRHQDVEGAA